MVGVNRVLLFKLYDLFHTQSWKIVQKYFMTKAYIHTFRSE